MGGGSERCLKWGGGGSLRDLSKNILKQGWAKAKVVHRGEGVLKVSPPLPPRKILIKDHAESSFKFYEKKDATNFFMSELKKD